VTITAAWTQLLRNVGQTVSETTALVYDAFTQELALPPLVKPGWPTAQWSNIKQTSTTLSAEDLFSY